MTSWEKVCLLDSIRDRRNFAVVTLADNPNYPIKLPSNKLLCRPCCWAEEEKDDGYSFDIYTDDGKARVGGMVFYCRDMVNIEEVEATAILS